MVAHSSSLKTPCPFKHLLAKSSDTPDDPEFPERLQGHTAKVLEVAETLLEEIDVELLTQLELDVDCWRERLQRATMLGAFLHDLGKANDQFQLMVRRKRDVRRNPQSVRHEALSGVLCTYIEELRGWLCPSNKPYSEIVFRAALCAAVGHHLKTGKPENEDASDFELTVFLNHPDFDALLSFGQSRLGLGERPKFSAPRIFSTSGIEGNNLHDLITELYIHQARKWFKRADEETKRWLAAVKAMVVASDVAGSALSGNRRDVRDWVKEAIRDVLSADELKQLVTERLNNDANPSRAEFQRKVEESPDHVTLVRAGCGAGKTVAAYKWAEQRATRRKLFFCYPTTGTTSQGFQDYAKASGIKAKLIHSRASVDLESILGTPDDTQEVNDKGHIEEVADLRLESLEAWSPPLIICTVDTVLGLIQNNRRGLFSFPAFMRSAFVFDEIHSYDSQLFGALLCFLQTFKGAYVLLMTASLPPRMLNALEKVCGRLEPIKGPKAREEAPRYRLRFERENPEVEAWQAAKAQLKNRSGGKVLWIANTVDRAVSLYLKAVNEYHLPVLLYHARFRYFIRVEKHEAVINAFDRRKTLEPVLVITTQVAEMSLDLSADLLITDLAPPASLIQRLGRLNRDEDEPADTLLALILETKDEKRDGKIYAHPYVQANGEPSEDFMLVYDWLNALPCAPESVSQEQLAEALEKVLSQQKELFQISDSAWLDGEWDSQIAPLRGGDSVPIVLKSDIKAIRDAGKGLPEKDRRDKCKKEAIRRSLSIRARPQVNGWKRLKEYGLYRVGPDDQIGYNDEIGAWWK